MRILVVANQYVPVIGGIEVLLADRLVPGLRRRGHDVEVLTELHQLAQDPHEVRDGVPVHRTGFVQATARRDAGGLVRARQHVRDVVAAFDPDVLHGHDPGVVVAACLAVTGARRPSVLTLHLRVDDSNIAHQRAAIARMLRTVDRVTGVAPEVLAAAVALEPSIADRSSVVRNGIDLPERPPPLPGGAPVLLCLGRLHEQKGFDVALRAFALLAARHPDARLVLAGDGPARRDLEVLAAALGIAAAVDVLGVVARADVPALLARASLVVLPSRYEGMPMVALEAAAAARPVVSTAVQGLGEIVVDGRTGSIVPVDDPAALAAALDALLRDRQRAADLGTALRAHVAAHFSLDAALDQYESLFASVAGT